MDKTVHSIMKELRAEGKRQIRNLKRGGITGRVELTYHSPEGIAEKCDFSEEELDAVVQRSLFPRIKAWIRRRNARKMDARRYILRTPYLK